MKSTIISWHGSNCPLEQFDLSCSSWLLYCWTESQLSRLMTKPTKWHMRPAKSQISLGTCPVWSESSLSAWRKLGSLATDWVHSKEWSDWADAQAELSLCWDNRSFCWFYHTRPLNFVCKKYKQVMQKFIFARFVFLFRPFHKSHSTVIYFNGISV